MKRQRYPSDVTDEEWEFLAPYLTLMTEDAPQRDYSLRDVFDGLRYIVRTGASWRQMPHDLPPWYTVFQQTRRWIRAGCFETIVHDLRALLRALEGRNENPSAVIYDSRTLQSTPESGGRAGYDGHKKKNGSKIHIAVDTLGYLLGMVITPANQQDRAQVDELSKKVQDATDESVKGAFVDQGYTGKKAAAEARKHGIELIVVKFAEAKKGFVLLPRRWVVERSQAWAGRFRRLARDYERLPETLAGFHWVAFACLMISKLFRLLQIPITLFALKTAGPFI